MRQKCPQVQINRSISKLTHCREGTCCYEGIQLSPVQSVFVYAASVTIKNLSRRFREDRAEQVSGAGWQVSARLCESHKQAFIDCIIHDHMIDSRV